MNHPYKCLQKVTFLIFYILSGCHFIEGNSLKKRKKGKNGDTYKDDSCQISDLYDDVAKSWCLLLGVGVKMAYLQNYMNTLFSEAILHTKTGSKKNFWFRAFLGDYRTKNWPDPIFCQNSSQNRLKSNLWLRKMPSPSTMFMNG